MSENIITLNRGDTYEFDVTIYDDSSSTGRYILHGDDALYFGLMDPHQPFEEALLKKKYTADDCDEAGNLSVYLDAEDTADLIPGLYYYSIKLHRKSEDETELIDRVVTIIPNTKFIILD